MEKKASETLKRLRGVCEVGGGVMRTRVRCAGGYVTHGAAGVSVRAVQRSGTDTEEEVT